VAMLASCATRNRCNRLFPPETIKNDSLVSISTQTNSIELRDTIIHDTIRLKGEEICITDTLPCPEAKYSRKERKNGLSTEITLKNGVLTVDCKEDSLNLAHSIEVKKYKSIIRRQATQLQKSKSNEHETRTIIENRVPWWMWMLLGGLLAIIIYLWLKKK
jgi:hypothetical protein